MASGCWGKSGSSQRDFSSVEDGASIRSMTENGNKTFVSMKMRVKVVPIASVRQVGGRDDVCDPAPAFGPAFPSGLEGEDV
jgi:hypothetical protein